MSTQQRELGKDQEAPLFLHTKEEKISPAQVFPQPPGRPPRPKSNRWYVIGAVLIALALIVSLGAILLPGLIQHPGGQVLPTPTPTPGTGDKTPTPSAGVILGPQACPTAVADPAHWDAIIGTHSGTSKVESVSCGNIMDTPSLQALVTVRSTDPGAILDVYVYTNITGAKPTQIFKLTGLVKGDAKISGYNTVMTAEVDKNSSLNAGKAILAMTPDLFREFDWSSAEGTLAQTAFPGIFPDLTRYQAEADQAQVKQGQESWKNDAARVAESLVTKFFQWNRSLTATIVSGGGPYDVDATVRVVEAAGQDSLAPVPTVTVQLSRLEGNIHNIWVAIAVEDSTLLSLTSIEPRSLITSPVKLEGIGTTYGANEGIIGPATVFDHLYTDIGHVTLIGAVGMGKTTYSTNVIYASTFHAGIQEGVVAVYEANVGTNNEISSAVMVKVLLNPEPGVALGPLPCPDAVKDASYWDAFLRVPQQSAQAERVSCGNLLGRPSIQALVTARVLLQSGDRPRRNVYIFDNITSAHPTLLFKLEGLFDGDARISAYSTIMTAQIDRNSGLNQGQPEAAMQIDLFREFQWAEKTASFVQVAFPGIFPDLTRYQAEQNQAQGNQGENAWKYDAVQVAKALEEKFFAWQRTVTAKLISGGGSQDVSAKVLVQESPAQGAQSTGPSVVVTLSRLEGNTHNFWVVIGVEDATVLTLTNIEPGSLITSPVTLEGTGAAFEAVIGQAIVFDHLYNDIGHAQVIGDNGMGKANYSTKVLYTSSFKGVQEGVVAVFEANGGISTETYFAVMVKVLLSA